MLIQKNLLKKYLNLKGRPNLNPLIIHYYDLKLAMNDIVINDNFIKLYKHFCPGPITFILTEKIILKLIL